MFAVSESRYKVGVINCVNSASNGCPRSRFDCELGLKSGSRAIRTLLKLRTIRTQFGLRAIQSQFECKSWNFRAVSKLQQNSRNFIATLPEANSALIAHFCAKSPENNNNRIAILFSKRKFHLSAAKIRVGSWLAKICRSEWISSFHSVGFGFGVKFIGGK